jgi:uncharacterized membrane protein YkvA (DUF1232 family)
MSERHYAKHYSQAGLRAKLGRFAWAAGREVVELALQLYYATDAPETPKWAKAVIYGALGYFIAPLDGLPDFTPLVGFSDDLTVLAAAAAAVTLHITPEVKERARRKVSAWFGEPIGA